MMSYTDFEKKTATSVTLSKIFSHRQKKKLTIFSQKSFKKVLCQQFKLGSVGKAETNHFFFLGLSTYACLYREERKILLC